MISNVISIKISLDELKDLVNSRFETYDEILKSIELNQENNLKIFIDKINIQNNLIEFYSELNRYIYNSELNIDINSDLANSKFYNLGLETVEIIETVNVIIKYSDQSIKIFDIPKKYIFKLDNIISEQFELRKQLEWIRPLKISSYIDKLKNKFTNNIVNDINPKEELEQINSDELILEEISHYIKLIEYSEKNFNNVNFFLKGGFVIGFKLIQLICYQAKLQLSQLNQKQIILDTLEFIRDFDIAMCIDTDNNQNYQIELDNFLSNDIVSNYFRKEGQVVIVLRDKNNLKTKSNPLESFIELSIKNCKSPHDLSHLVDLEIPMTSMLIQINLENIKLVFQIIKSYYLLQNNLDFDENFYSILINQINLLQIQIHKTTPIGLFDITQSSYLDRNKKFSDQMIRIINKSSEQIELLIPEIINTKSINPESINPESINPESINPESIKIFLASGMTQPDRLFIRLINKNIPKSLRCEKLLEKYNIDINTIDWLLNPDVLIKIINIFLTNLSAQYIDWEKIKKTNCSSCTINKFMSDLKVSSLEKTLFLECNLGRLIGEIDKISNSNDFNKMIRVYNLLKIIFGKNQTQQIRNNFNPKDQSNIFRVQKSYDNLVNNIIWFQIKKFI